ncbi:hypothetical protein UFOVP68_12 [uncultured Caudovirales phage]|uniref:Ubiquitin-activating enzyme E1, FCCH domain containing protein n=1 Tax=uncultured Caudovirales phage TaxID=2100421 RepID=A0A6J5L155_9CAUD|nr:hypothetical protein UFOVP68_12 [uncultured Caudovirales phage]
MSRPPIQPAGQIVAIWQSFNAGELSPLLDGRTDQEKYFSGAKTMQNFLPTVAGPAVRRAGTRYINPTKNNGFVQLVPFTFSAAQSYVLEFGDSYLRFWVNRGLLQSSGSAYEIATPFAAANLVNSFGVSNLRTTQSADTMWIAACDGSVQPQTLRRAGATSWSIAANTFPNGPFKDVDPTQTITVSASAATGAGVTITASTSIFTADDVGTAFYMETGDPTGDTMWESAKSYTVGARIRYSGNVYQCTATTGTGGGSSVSSQKNAYPPVHLIGLASDGINKWLYLHSSYGWGTITAQTGTTATMTVTSRIPDDIVSAGSTTRWAKAAFSTTEGWPTDVTFFKQRLVFSRGRQLFMSQVGSYDNFTERDGPDITSATAINLTLTEDRLDNVRWMIQSRALLCGTSVSELSIQEQTQQKVFAADNLQNVPQTQYGSGGPHPIRVGEAVLFVQRSGKRLREMKYDFSIDRYKAEDLNVLAPHVADAGIIGMDFALEPDNQLWTVLSDGKVAVLTYNRDRGVVGWTPVIIGGTSDAGAWGAVEAVAVIPKPDATRDDVWLVVRRTVNGNTVRYVEIVEDYRLCEAGVENSFFVDCGLTYSGTPATIISGLGHLEGETVQILVDGSTHADRVVSSGSVTLDRPGSVVNVGLKFTSILQTMRPDMGAQNGSGQTRRRSVSQAVFRFVNSVGGKFGPSLTSLNPVPTLNPRAAIGAPAKLFNGDTDQLVFPANMDTDGFIFFVQDQPLPTTLVAIISRMQVND